MLLIYVPKLTNRLGYTLNLIFKYVLEVDYQITINKEEFIAYQGAKLAYGNEYMEGALFIQSTQLLFQTTIECVDLKPFTKEENIFFFPTYNKKSSYSFDILAAIFFLVSRYEEYLPHEIDKYGRYKPENSTAYTLGFLHKPIVNQWIIDLSKQLSNYFPSFTVPQKQFKTVLTIDIDNAFAYQYKGIFRTLIGYLKSLFNADYKAIVDRTKVLLRLKPDPFDTYKFLISTIKKHKIQGIFFVLYGEFGSHDHNVSYNNARFQILLRSLGDFAKIGIHPSFASFDNPRFVKREIQRLSAVMQKPIARSRFHYIRFRLPESYRILIDNGIKNDYSMGYSSEVGFRASICTPHPFYDLENNCETNLMIHPFFIMESTLRYHKNVSAKEAFTYYKDIIDSIKEVDGSFHCIWHNESVGNYAGWEGWSDVFMQVIEYAMQKRNA